MNQQRTITEHDLQNAARLRSLWHTKKDGLHLTQEAAGAFLGFSQSAVSQYLSGDAALNTKAILGWARLLGVHPASIDPILSWLGEYWSSVVAMGVNSTTSGAPVSPEQELLHFQSKGATKPYGVLVDAACEVPWLSRGCVLIVESLVDPVPDDLVLLVIKDAPAPLIRKLVSIGPSEAVVCDFGGSEETFMFDTMLNMDVIVDWIKPNIDRPLRENPPSLEERRKSLRA